MNKMLLGTLFSALFCVVFAVFLNADGYWAPTPPSAGSGYYYYWVPQSEPRVYYYSVPQVVVPQVYGQPPDVYYIYPNYPGYLIGRYSMIVTECYSVGNVAIPPSYSFSGAYCTVYADGTLIFTFIFNNGSRTEYRLQNPVLRTRHSNAINKTIYSRVEKIGAYPAFSPIRCEVYSTGRAIHEIVLFESNNTSVTISFSSR